MNGYENLKKKLLELGATKNQVESRVVELTIAALAGEQENNAEYLLQLLDDVKADYRQRAEIADAAKKVHDDAYKAQQYREQLNTKKGEDIAEAINGLNLIINQLYGLYSELFEPETAEMRDRKRAFEMFRANTEVNTCYDNTAFIKAAGNILSGIREPDEPKQEIQEQRKAQKALAEKKYKSVKDQLDEIRKTLCDYSSVWRRRK